MKTNKLWSIMMMLMFVLGTAVTFSSCSNDDDNDNKNEITTTTSIYGTWKMRWGFFRNKGNGENNYWLYTIKKDGTLVVYDETEYVVDEKVTDTKKVFIGNGDYIYDATGRITLRYDGRTLSYLVTYIGEKTMSWMNGSGDIEILDRQ